MKFAAALLLVISYITIVSAHMGMLYPTPRGGYGTKQFNGRIHTFIGFKDNKHSMRFPCGGYAPGPVTEMRAGQIVNVRFYASDMDAKELSKQPARPSNPRRQFAQARHGGGMCEFSLSYDNGKTFHLIGRYTRTCPDAYYQWPVKIPSNVPSCTKQNQCLFVWSWTANILPQYYMNCADIRLRGATKNARLPSKSIQIVDFKGYKRGVTEPGDGIKHKSSTGPTRKEINDNMNGRY
ncbi:hypothetical protein BX616_004285 [Lobosporangium transversale]|uniref:Chitin-binding type-4 domain-containing protein n=1 Tax=Lobosporangium transversale TaxID=64571 RepID=A0A1Y2G6P0_9FUNG|nr:hypothetical protein BCR41DRAFT_365229 [Lobosporangium transversale]KAF9916236.1 hypothetical protein BX616_004285 [Lobosporangium transversale]ORY95120.1 hypothetical protein BCR41DRAFT_365229 [Lobosporangium transversale]|eukprot:XP_021875327.1 hypothetical protein BCR41DRAFT_365229 [Lobosporangium transversale]